LGTKVAIGTFVGVGVFMGGKVGITVFVGATVGAMVTTGTDETIVGAGTDVGVNGGELQAASASSIATSRW
jgi:pectate lyase